MSEIRLGGVEIISVDKTEDFRNLRNDWNQLLSHSNSNNIFLTWEWLYTWWEVYGTNKKLFIVCIRNGNQLLGIAPFYVEKRKVFGILDTKTIRFLGTGIVASDYLDFILTAGNESELLNQILMYLVENTDKWDILLLEDIPAQSTTLNVLRPLVQFFNLTIRQISCRICSYLSMPPSWEEFLNSLSRNRRKKIKQSLRKIEHLLSPTFSVVQSEEDLDKALEVLTRFHVEKFDNTSTVSSFSFPHFVQFHSKLARNLLKKGCLYMTYLTIQGKMVAVNYAFRYSNKIFDYNGGYHQDYKQYGLGSLLTTMSLRNVMNEGVEEWDFTRGRAMYKQHLTKGERENIILLIGKNNAFDRSFIFQRNLIMHASRVLRRFLPSSFYELLRMTIKKRKFS